jgi:hypothetical protein
MVKFILRRVSVLLAAILLLFLVSCDSGGAGGGSGSSSSWTAGSGTAVIVAPDGDPTYVSLSSGILADSEADTTNWDLKFTYDRTIHTNSGASATLEGSSGTGGVYYVSGATSVAGVSDTDFSAAKAVFDGGETDWDTYKHYDETRYISGMGGATEAQLNVMSYHGYDSGDGLTSNTAYSTYNYSADSFYDATGMPPTYTMSNNVYIIRHGDGTHHSAIQITAMEDPAAGRTYGLTYYTLD